MFRNWVQGMMLRRVKRLPCHDVWRIVGPLVDLFAFNGFQQLLPSEMQWWPCSAWADYAAAASVTRAWEMVMYTCRTSYIGQINSPGQVACNGKLSVLLS